MGRDNWEAGNPPQEVVFTGERSFQGSSAEQHLSVAASAAADLAHHAIGYIVL